MARRRDYVIGVDIGTQSTKALLCDARGRIVAQQRASYQPDTPQPLWAEQWPDVWLDAVFECIAALRRAGAGVGPGFARDACGRSASAALYGGSGHSGRRANAAAASVPDLDGPPRQAEVDWVRANVDLARLDDDHRQRRRQLLRLHQDAVAAQQPARRLGAARATSCRPTRSSSTH